MSINSKYNPIKEFANSDYYKKYAQTADLLLDIRIEILKFMKANNLTQDQLAQSMGVDQKQVHRMVSGSSNISFRTLQKFCVATGAKLEMKW